MFLIALINFAANCGSYLPTLEWMKNKKAITNIQNVIINAFNIHYKFFTMQ